MQLKHFILAFGVLTLANTAFSQTATKDEHLKGWYLKDKNADNYYGISLQKAYDFVKDKKPTQVIVAVIDSGIDTLHEDLKPVLWRNPKEIPGNKKDDDKNGYVDDYYGWNFLGGKDGRNVNKDSYEGARMYHSLKAKFDKPNFDASKLSADEKEEYAIYSKLKNDINATATNAQQEVMILKNIKKAIYPADSILRIGFKPHYNGTELENFIPKTEAEKNAKMVISSIYQAFDMPGTTNTELVKEFTSYYEGQVQKAEATDAAPENYRGDIVKDNYYDFNDKFYGNPDVMAGTPMHGTHVSGIIGAVRNNGLGGDGVASNVKIMTVRAVPDGDEHDKDIALAIRYAVDNGAKVINMSFGKSYSPEKKWVDEAVAYAQSKGVLLVHAAGNENKNCDVENNYPNPNFKGTTTKASNFITIGASDFTPEKLAAVFSNYGKTEVDVFSPGVKIYNTLPGGNKYGFLQGTSMASPVVAGLAAFILQYYPDLSAEQVRYCIEKGAQNPNSKTLVPGSENEKVDFATLSKTGGIINAYESIKIASTLKGERKATTTKPAKKSTKKKN